MEFFFFDNVNWSVTISTDASDYGYGSSIMDTERVTAGARSETESKLSSTWREIKAVVRA